MNFVKSIVIASDDAFLTNSVVENLQSINLTKNYTISIISSANFAFNKIDLLIFDLDNRDIKNFDNINNVINLSNKQLVDQEIRISRPLKLIDLLRLIDEFIQNTSIFCLINDNIIYNQRLQTIKYQQNLIKLTEKENEIFSFFLQNSNIKIDKATLLTNLWNYHEDSKSLTVGTHLYRLKAKLPQEILETKNNLYQLNIDKLM